MNKYIAIILLLNCLSGISTAQTYFNGPDEVYDFVINSNDNSLIISTGGAFKFYDLSNREIKSVIPFDLQSEVTRMDITGNGSLLVAGLKDGNLIIVNLFEKILTVLPDRKNEIVTAVGINRDGSIVAAGYADGTLRIIDPATGKIRYEIAAHRKSLNDLEFYDNNRCIMSVGGDGHICGWEVKTGKPIFSEREERHWIRALDISSDEKIVVTSGDMGVYKKLVMKSTSDYQLLGSKMVTFSWLTDISFFPGDNVIAIGTYSGKVRIKNYSASISMEKDVASPVYRIRTAMEGYFLVLYVASGQKVQKIYVKDMKVTG